MKIIENKSELRDFLTKLQKKGKSIGLIPTMGSIHKGHLSLIQNCKQKGYFSLVTIFVNPTQFNDSYDFKMYPRDHIEDKKFLDHIGTDLLFFPKTKDLYPRGIMRKKTIFEYRGILCDIYRPNHFDGVTTVVDSLFNLIKPDHVFFGEKDFQQLKIINKMIEKNRSAITMHSCLSVRMSNGMSYSSRYKKFSNFEKKIFDNVADILMKYITDLRMNFDFSVIKILKNRLIKLGIKKIDYLEVKNEVNLSSVFNKNNSRLFIAFYIGKIRIMDNFILY